MVKEMLKVNVMSQAKDMRLLFTNADREVLLFTNADGEVLKKLELMDSIREKDPDIVCPAKTKLPVEDVFKITNYKVWRKGWKDGRGGEGMVLVKF